MYWLLNDKNLLKRNHVEQETEGHFQDLFMNKVEGNDNLLGFNSNWNRENLFYLHGGIHLLSKNIIIRLSACWLVAILIWFILRYIGLNGQGAISAQEAAFSVFAGAIAFPLISCK